MFTFKDLDLRPEIQHTLDALGFVQPTEIQRKAIPLLVDQQGIDFHGQAQTGTGKTLAFGLPLLQKIMPEQMAVQSLIVAPTRELVVQICESLKQVAQSLQVSIAPVYGGMSMENQIAQLRRGVHVVVGTPGRLNDHLRRRTLSLDKLRILVLDEADIMLDMGFREEVEEILTFAPKNRQIWLFSATVKAGISAIMQQHMKDTVSVVVDKKNVAAANTKQYFCVVPARSRLSALCRFIDSEPEFYGFIFCQTKILTSEVAEKLALRGYRVAALHGDMSQLQRNSVIKKFKNREYTILCATDVAARGIDVAHLTHVINYSLPEDHESYVHRIGRTGRAGREGVAITFVNKSEVRVLSMLQRKFRLTIDPIDVPSFAQLLEARMRAIEACVEQLGGEQGAPITPELKSFVHSLDEQQAKDALTRLLFDKFLAAFSSDDEAVFTPAHAISTDKNSDIQELYLNLGADDRIKPADVATYFMSSGCLTEDQLYKIRVIKRRTFVELPSDRVHEVVQALRGKKLLNKVPRIGFVSAEEESSAPRHRRRRDRDRGPRR